MFLERLTLCLMVGLAAEISAASVLVDRESLQIKPDNGRRKSGFQTGILEFRHLLYRKTDGREDVRPDNKRDDDSLKASGEGNQPTATQDVNQAADVVNGLLKTENSKEKQHGIFHALLLSLLVIIMSEIGDNTFFIAAVLAMRHSRLTVLLGTLSAECVMHITSVLVGYSVTVIHKTFIYSASSAVFAVLGLKMLKEGWNMSPNEGMAEYKEAEAEVKKRENERTLNDSVILTWAKYLGSTVLLKSFTLTFVAEWGDRSQIATMMLGTREDILGVITGGLTGHALCSGLAVVGGHFVAKKISIRTVTFTGGVVFLTFAASGLFWM